MISDKQLEALLRELAPGQRLREATPLGERTLLLRLGETQRAVLRLAAPLDPESGDPLQAEAAALSTLAGELELPIPSLLASALAHETPALLLSYREGQPLEQVVGQLGEDERYSLGQQLGQMIARVHNYTTASYGPLSAAALPTLSRVVAEPSTALPSSTARPAFAVPQTSPDPGAPSGPDRDDDRRYFLARYGRILDALQSGGLLAPGLGEALYSWAEQHLAPSGQLASLVHGELAPERILVRRSERGVRLSGIVGWGLAQAWRPAWEHVAFAGACASEEYFSVRVGYGNAYDATTERRYDQHREFALQPYRNLLLLEAGVLEPLLANRPPTPDE